MVRIISVGVYINHKSILNEQFRSAVSFFDFDMVILNPSVIFSEYELDIFNPTYLGCRLLRESESQKILDDISRRKSEITELIKLGRTAVLVLPPPEKCYYSTGQKTYSGSGKNKVTQQFINELNLSSAIPLKDFSTVTASGTSIEFRGSEPFKTYWEKMKNYHFYSAYLSSTVGKPFLFIKGTTKVVGTWVPTEKGVFLILPSIYDEGSYKTKKDYNQFCSLFIDALTELTSDLNKSIGDYSLPAWTTAYFLPDEKEQKEQLSTKEYELQGLLSQISQSKEKLSKIEKYKLLLSGSGRALEMQVATVLKEIGFSVEPGAEGRDDLILKYGEKIAVVEIKGVSKSASEKHAAQLEKWVAEYVTSHDVNPKGILIVNAYCNTPLHARNEPAFPEQMVSYATNREHCLITTTQLLSFYLSVISKPEGREQLINDLFDTKGVFKKFLNYKDFLLVQEADVGEEKTEIKQI
jgi:hypothetical protein